ncbi:hypothetical protein MBLNU230_g2953t1 [Neophaeotheca triangularis]
MRFDSTLTLCGLLGIATAETSYKATEYSISDESARSALKQEGSCCSALSLLLGGKVVFPNSTLYDASLGSYWTQQEANLEPACIFIPDNKFDVSAAVTVLGAFDNVFPGKCRFAIRSGGHTPFAGAANIEGGVTFDLQKFNDIKVDSEDQTIKIGPGSTWGEIYAVTDAQNISTSGGRVGIVGTGGLITGGGVSFFSPRYGYVCDNVENFQVVLASGKIVDANAKTNPDLWRALRGGSNNFGIVTEFTMRTFEQGDFWGGFLVLDPSTLDQQFQAFEDLTASTPYDRYAALIFSLSYQPEQGVWLSGSNIQYTKPEPYPATFRNFTSLPQLYNTLRISNLSDKASELSASNPSGRRQLFTTATYSNSAAFLKRFYEIANEEVQPLSQIPNLLFSLSFQPLPTVIQATEAQNGGNSLGLDESDGNLFNALLSAGWDDEADDELVRTHARTLFERANAEADELGIRNSYIYLNYADRWQDPIEGYGAEVKERLETVSEKYDPRGIFQRLVPGGFKLFG